MVNSFRYFRHDRGTKKLFLFLLCYGCCFSVVALTPQEIASNAFPSVVVVIAQNSNGEDFSYGSGVFVEPDVVATNLHVIEGAAKVRIRPIGIKTEGDVTGFTAVDYDNDLVLLKTQGKDGKPLTVADDSTVSIGDDVYVIGNPQGLEGTFSKGMVSGKRDANNHKILQITAPISQGSSGGPVLSEKGELIGVAVAYITEGQNLNFAIPSSCLIMLMAKQLDTMPLSHFTTSDVNKVSPDVFESAQYPIQFGNLLLYLGMSEGEAIEKIEDFYKVSPLPHSEGSSGEQQIYGVLEKKGAEYIQIGLLHCKQGKVESISRDLGSASPQGDLVSIFKTLVARIQELQNKEEILCVIDTYAGNHDSPNGPVAAYGLDLKFGDYAIRIDAGGQNNQYWFSLSETFK